MFQILQSTIQSEPQNHAPSLRFPGGTVLTRLNVYDTPGPDGQRGGTPHVHLVCTELYYVLAGSGAVECIDSKGFSRVELSANSAFLFSAGTVHRLINHGDLEILIVMQNSGLPERGDNIVTFPLEVLADPSRFAASMKAETLSDALRRRDMAVAGFLELKDAFTQSKEVGHEALVAFYKLCLQRVKPHLQDWYSRVTHGAFEDAQDSLHKIIAATGGNINHLLASSREFITGGDCVQTGFCGQLHRYLDSATLHLEGQKRF